MGQRLDLHALLVAIPDVTKVYFQEPGAEQMQYPCILYKRYQARTRYADNRPYTQSKRYMVTIIDRNPDSGIPDSVAALPMCTFERHFVADNLHHDVYNLYF